MVEEVAQLNAGRACPNDAVASSATKQSETKRNVWQNPLSRLVTCCMALRLPPIVLSAIATPRRVDARTRKTTAMPNINLPG